MDVINLQDDIVSAFRIIAEDVASDLEYRQLTSVIELAPCGIVSLQADGKICMFNREASRMFGISAEEAYGRLFLTLLRTAALTIDDLMGLQGPCNNCVGGKRADGSGFPLELLISREVDEWGVEMVMILVVDKTRDAEHAAQLIAEQRKLSTIMNSAISAIMTMGVNGEIEQINISGRKMFGMSEAEARKANLSSLLVLSDGRRPHPSEISVLLQTFAGTSQYLQGERTDGSRFPMRIVVSEVKEDGLHLYSAIIADLTKEMEDSAKLQAEQRKTKAIMDSALNAIVTIDENGDLQMANASARDLFGLDRDAVSRTKITDIIEMDFRIDQVALSQMAGKVHDLQGRRTDGSQFPLRMSISEVNLEGYQLFTIIMRDISVEKEDKQRIAVAQQVIHLEQAKLAALLDSTVRQPGPADILKMVTL